MFQKYIARKVAKQSVSWMAKMEAKVLFTAATRYPALSILETEKA